jgi:hypothetical protein
MPTQLQSFNTGRAVLAPPNAAAALPVGLLAATRRGRMIRPAGTALVIGYIA